MSKRNPSSLETLFYQQLQEEQLPEPKQELSFTANRKWRFDFAWPDKKLAVELEGGTWNKGRHTRPMGFAADCQKYNHAALLGWRVLRFTGDMVRSNEAVDMVRLALLGQLQELAA